MTSVAQSKDTIATEVIYCVVDLALNEIIAASNVRYGVLRIPPVLEIEGKIVTVAELLSVSREESITVVDKDYTIATLWSALIARIITQLNIKGATISMTVVLPSWIDNEIKLKLQDSCGEFGSCKIKFQQRALTIAQAHNEAIPPTLASNVAVVEYLDSTITLTAARRKGQTWQTGKTVIERVSQITDEPRIIEWLFTATDSLFRSNEGLLLIDAPEGFIEQIRSRIQLLNKLIRVEPIKRNFVVERTLAKLSPFITHSPAEEKKFTPIAQEPEQQKEDSHSPEKAYPSYYKEVIASSGYVDDDDFEDSKYTTSTIVKIALPVIVTLLIAGFIMMMMHDDGPLPAHRSKEIFEPTDSLVLSQQYESKIQKIFFIVPSGWTRQTEGRNESHSTHQEVYLYHSIRPWEMIKITLAKHALTSAELHQEQIKHPTTLKNFQMVNSHGRWSHWTFDYYPERFTSNAPTRIKNDLLVGRGVSIDFKCIMSDNQRDIPECNVVLNSILNSILNQ